MRLSLFPQADRLTVPSPEFETVVHTAVDWARCGRSDPISDATLCRQGRSRPISSSTEPVLTIHSDPAGLGY